MSNDIHFKNVFKFFKKMIPKDILIAYWINETGFWITLKKIVHTHEYILNTHAQTHYIKPICSIFQFYLKYFDCTFLPFYVLFLIIVGFS